MIHAKLWREGPERISAAARLLGDADMRAMLAIMELDHPLNQDEPIHSPEQAARRLGRIEGYEEYKQRLLSLKEPPRAKPTTLISKWGAKEEEIAPPITPKAQ